MSILFWSLLSIGILLVALFFLYFFRRPKKKSDSLFDSKAQGGLYRENFISGVLKGLLGLSKSDETKEGKLVDFGDGSVAVGEKEGFGFVGKGGGSGSGEGKGKSDVEDSSSSEETKRLSNSRKRLEASIQSKKTSSKHSSSTKSGKAGGGKGGGSSGPGPGAKGGTVFKVDAKTSINIKDALSSLKGTDLGSVLSTLKKDQHEYFVEKIMKLKFATKKEFLETVIVELGSLLEESYKEMNYRISKLRKAGKNVNAFSLKLMAVPLKVQLFKATLSKKDFDVAVSILEKVDQELTALEKTLPNEGEKKE